MDTTKISAELKMEQDGKTEMIAVINQVSERYTVQNDTQSDMKLLIFISSNIIHLN